LTERADRVEMDLTIANTRERESLFTVRTPKQVNFEQGDQIWRILAQWVTVCH
jgi:hypothetical protein